MDSLYSRLRSVDETQRDGWLCELIVAGEKIRTSEALDHLNEFSPFVQVSIIYAERFLGRPSNGERLTAIAENEEAHIELREAAIEAIGDLRPRGVIRRLRKLCHSSHPSIRFWTCDTLGRLGARSAKGDLARLVTDDAQVFDGQTVGEVARKALERL